MDNEAQKAGEGPSFEEKLAAAEKEKQEYLDGWKRAKADLINYKKEEAERAGTLVRFANQTLLEELILVLDSFTLGLSVLEGDKVAEKGMNLVRLQLEDILKKYGLMKIPIAPGSPFDPNLEEAVGEIESDHAPGSVAEVVEAGYRLNDRVLRPAKVRIAKNKSQ